MEKDDIIREGDNFLFTNPSPDSSLKEVLRVCASTEVGFVIPESKDLVLRKYPVAWCKKLHPFK